MEETDQILIVMDLTQLTTIYTSKRSMDKLGIEPETNDPLKMMSKVHPEDLHRFGLGRSKLMDLDKNLYIAHKGAALLSTDIRMLKPNGEYAKHLFQCYMFYSPIPHESVYYIQVNTNIEEYDMHNDAFHYYVGDDISLFRFPDDELLNMGHHLTHREIEIIKMISHGYSSKEIAEKLFISIHTVNTHRRNILCKTHKVHLSDVIFDLMEQGLL